MAEKLILLINPRKNSKVRRTIDFALESVGMSVHIADNAAEAMDLANDYVFDAIVVEERIDSRTSGNELIRELRVAHPYLNALLISKKDRPEELHADAFIAMPWETIDALVEIVEYLAELNNPN